jgi:hypothetical protein
MTIGRATLKHLRRRGAVHIASWQAQACVPGYLDGWAKNLARSVSNGALKRLWAECTARAKNQRLSESDRNINKQQAAALKRLVK